MKRILILTALLAAGSNCFAEAPDSRPVLRLDATASNDVPEDTVIATLFVERQDSDAVVAQKQVTQAIADVLPTIKATLAVESHTGAIQTYPAYGTDGHIQSWRVRNELIIESHSPAEISRLLTKLAETLSVASVCFKLSTAAERTVQLALQAEAVKSFRAKALQITQQLGYQQFTPADLQLSESSGRTNGPQTFMMKAAARSSGEDNSQLSLEPGKTTVSVTVSGTVRLDR